MIILSAKGRCDTSRCVCRVIPDSPVKITTVSVKLAISLKIQIQVLTLSWAAVSCEKSSTRELATERE